MTCSSKSKLTSLVIHLESEQEIESFKIILEMSREKYERMNKKDGLEEEKKLLYSLIKNCNNNE